MVAYEGVAPADIVLVCGVFGNIPDQDVFHTIDLPPQRCRPSATVIWTRNRLAPDLTPAIWAYFLEHRFAEVDFVADAELFPRECRRQPLRGGATAIAAQCAVLHVPRGAALTTHLDRGLARPRCNDLSLNEPSSTSWQIASNEHLERAAEQASTRPHSQTHSHLSRRRLTA